MIGERSIGTASMRALGTDSFWRQMGNAAVYGVMAGVLLAGMAGAAIGIEAIVEAIDSAGAN